MANFITLSILLAVCIVSPVFSAPATQVTIYHAESGRLVRATLAGVAADGITGDSHIKFLWHQDGSFESVDESGKYLLMGSGGALSLGETNEPTFKHKYTRTASGLYDHFSAVTSSGSTCYITFDWLGAQLTTCSESPLGGTDAENAKLQIRFP